MSAREDSETPPAVPPRTSSLISSQPRYITPHHLSSPLAGPSGYSYEQSAPYDGVGGPEQGEGESEEIPPSYEQTRLAEPGNPRFGRWRNWVEKRGQERRQEKEELTRTGQVEKSSWDLPQSSSSSSLDQRNEDETKRQSWSRHQRSRTEEELVDAARRRDALRENRLSTGSQFTISNPDHLQATPAETSREGRSRSSSAASVGGGGNVRLTKNVTIERLGSRFDRGLPEKPLCGMMLPTQPAGSGEADRFLLVGTVGGLYLVDLDPALSSSGPLRTSTLSPSAANSPTDSRSETRILPLWLGLGVHHLESFVEPAKPKSEGAKGLIVMLVGNESGLGGLEIKMWSISAIINLVKWRTFNESSIPLDLTPAPALSSTTPGHSRTSSFSAFKQSILTSASPKGKGKQLSSDSPSPISASLTPTAESTSPATDRNSLPYEWVNSFVKLPLPKPHSPILFFKLSRMPSRTKDEDQEEYESDDEDLTNEQIRKRTKNREEEGKLFLLVATKGVVYVFESSLEQRRSWKLTRELTAPSTPRFMQLVRSPETSQDTLHATAQPPPRHPRSSSASLSSIPNELIPYPHDLCLLLGTSYRSVLIRLYDCSVVELVIPSTSSPTSRNRSKSLSNSIKSTASSSSASHHRSTSSIKLNLLDHPIVKKVQQVVKENRQSTGVPAGFTGREQITLGRRLKDNGDSTDDLGRVKSIVGDEGRWIGNEELIVRVGKGKRNVKRFQLLTKGHSTQLFSTPLSSTSTVHHHNEASSSTPTIELKPLHTFEWPHDLSIRTVVHSTRTIVDSSQRSKSFRTHLVLVAFTSTGLSVQEGFVSLDSSSTPLFTPTPTAASTVNLSRLSLEVPQSRVQAEEEEEQDLSSSASLDFATDSAELCSSLDTSRGNTAGGHSHTYFYTRSHADYVVKRISIDLP
ncbi:uncharacterized protein JCM6883_006989 [Sporobolomyces salmoneus]|uniref:uncharacterized protein n=1 Tax=Sporobolomyces salmoneus TaxID=183962 RepID=UPI003176C9A3